MTIRVLLADDQALLRAGFRKLLESEDDIRVVAEAANGREAIHQVHQFEPDLVLMDIRMPEMDGLEATRLIARSAAPSRILILTTYDLDEYVFDALRAGASGFLLKDAPPEQLTAGIRAVAAGDGLLAPSVTRRLIAEFASRPQSDAAAQALLRQLTRRELDVLERIARGLSNVEIAKELFLGEATVKTHVSNLLVKLGVRDRVQAVVFAYETGLARPGRS